MKVYEKSERSKERFQNVLKRSQKVNVNVQNSKIIILYFQCFLGFS
jgi:hypothetical protein